MIATDAKRVAMTTAVKPSTTKRIPDVPREIFQYIETQIKRVGVVVVGLENLTRIAASTKGQQDPIKLDQNDRQTIHNAMNEYIENRFVQIAVVDFLRHGNFDIGFDRASCGSRLFAATRMLRDVIYEKKEKPCLSDAGVGTCIPMLCSIRVSRSLTPTASAEELAPFVAPALEALETHNLSIEFITYGNFKIIYLFHVCSFLTISCNKPHHTRRAMCFTKWSRVLDAYWCL